MRKILLAAFVFATGAAYGLSLEAPLALLCATFGMVIFQFWSIGCLAFPKVQTKTFFWWGHTKIIQRGKP
jgi:hypothetical protein